MSREIAHTFPNILFLTCHDLGRHLGCYGVPTVHSPHFDHLAESGVRATRAFATSPSCSPSRSALATGRYAHSNGVMGLTHPPFGWDLRRDEQHIAEILGQAGYDTHLFGFQHVSPYDERPGFSQIHIDHDRELAGPVSEKVAALLYEYQEPRPFYLEVNLEEPHRPYDQGDCVPDDSLGVTIPGYLPQSDASRQEMAGLQGAVRQADTAVGRILDALEDSGLAESTCVVFVADHGIAMPRAKCTLYDPGLEVALLLRWPNGFAGGRTIDDLISNVDLLPTLLELAGIPIASNVQGRSFAPLVRGESFVPRSLVFAEKTYHSYYDPMRAVRTERFKYIRNFEPTPHVEIPGDIAVGPIYRANVELYSCAEHVPAELYDLQLDPLEQHNLAGDEEYGSVQGWLDSSLTNWMRETGDALVDRAISLPGFQSGDANAGRPAAC